MKRNLLSLVLLAFGLSYAYGQGSTSSAMNGRVVDENGEPLIGATVIALHQPTGTDYGAVTNIDGYYFFPTIRVGGPYKGTASYIGFETKATDNIVLKLGEKRNINFSLAEAATQLAEIVVSAQTDAVINSGRTGAATNVTSETIDRNPSISRSIDDFVRLTPQAATGVGNGGTSIAGRSGRYNNITIDGAVNNDAFGLNASGQPGTNAGSEIISLDAVQEVSVQVAPYDVTKGSFTGGGINAVTRSGTN
ncbi:MAG: TonB-dependent receptor, partial [Cyclobacteriaceae bacterium]|nr:TonB-dependent receptor [Cyclobacteriaceae bacterium HetDA_MAG_MS6]